LQAVLVGAALILGLAGTVRAWQATASPSPAPDTRPSEEDPAGETYFEAIQVRIAEVEVVVTDEQGNRVTGLSRTDFVLFEDGERVEITSFAAYAPAEVRHAPSGILAPAVPSADTPIAAQGGGVITVLIDNNSLTQAGRKRLLKRLRDFVGTSLRPGQSLAVATHDTPGALRVVLPATDNVAAIFDALDRAEKPAPRGQAKVSEMMALVRMIQLAEDPSEGTAAGGAAALVDAREIYDRIQTLTRQLEYQARSTAEALEQLVQAVAGMPGRKAVLLVSGGVSQRPGEALINAWRNRFGETAGIGGISEPFDEQEGDITPILRRAAEHANGGRVVIYALASPAAPDGLSAEMGAGDVWTAGEDWTATMNLRESVEALALPTGGLVGFDDGGSTLALDELRSDLESYYSLAYVPAERRPGKDRRLRVEVTRPGLEVRHRSTYRERTNRELMVDHTRAALLLGHQANPLAVTVTLGPAARGKQRKTVELPMTVSLPLAKLVLLPRGPFHEGRLTIYVAAIDEEGRSSPVSATELPVRVPNEQLIAAASWPVSYATRLTARDTGQRIAVTVRDELGNQSATVFVDRRPGDPGGSAAARARRGRP
jgi:VWFA-related protein